MLLRTWDAAVLRFHLDEEVEDEEEKTEEEKEGSPGEAAAGKLKRGLEEAGGNGEQAGFAAGLVKRTGRNVAGKIAAEGGEFVIDPEDEFAATAPEVAGPEKKDAVAQASQKTEIGTSSPIQHGTSPQSEKGGAPPA